MDQLRESSWGPASDCQGAGTQIGKLPPMGVGQAPKTVPQSRAPSRKGLARGGRPMLTTQPGFGQGSGRQSRGQRSWTPPTLPATCPRGAWACKTASLPQVTALALLQSTAPSPFPGLWGLQSPQAPLLASRSGRSSPESGPPLLQRRDLAVSHQP